MRIALCVATLLVVAGCADPGEGVMVAKRGQYRDFKDFYVQALNERGMPDKSSHCLADAFYEALPPYPQDRLDDIARGETTYDQEQFASMISGYASEYITPKMRADCGV